MERRSFIKHTGLAGILAAGSAPAIAQTQPGLRGFTRRNLFRMRQFYEAYQGDETVSPLVRQLPWTHNLIILSQGKSAQEKVSPLVAQTHTGGAA